MGLGNAGVPLSPRCEVGLCFGPNEGKLPAEQAPTSNYNFPLFLFILFSAIPTFFKSKFQKNRPHLESLTPQQTPQNGLLDPTNLPKTLHSNHRRRSHRHARSILTNSNTTLLTDPAPHSPQLAAAPRTTPPSPPSSPPRPARTQQ
jgi:hypothetical protein